jgi:hypothetical protein
MRGWLEDSAGLLQPAEERPCAGMRLEACPPPAGAEMQKLQKQSDWRTWDKP